MSVTLDDFAAAHAAGAPQVVDVREPAEYVGGHVPGAASIPMGQLPDRLAEIDRSKPVFVICQGGGRSSAMTDVLLHHVFETHIHNDYVTGGLALAECTGAGYFVNGADEVAYDRTPISDAEEVTVGTSMVVRALATPGHTFSHLSYALTVGGEPVAVFTGGSLLYGATGRPDLMGSEHTDDLGPRPVRLRAPAGL